MPKVIDLTHQRGDSFSRTLRVDRNIAASSFDEVWFTVRSSIPADSITDETDALSSGTLTSGEIAENGQQSWSVTIDNPNWTVGRHFYDVQARTGSGQIFTLIRGRLKVFEDITRSR